MTGVEIEYFLGIVFAVSSLTEKTPYITNKVKFLIGLVLLILAIFNYSFIK